MHPEHNLQQILQNPCGGFSNITKKLKLLAQLNDLWVSHINAKLVTHCRVANFREPHLVIEVDSATWLSQLRYELPELVRKLRVYPELKNLQTIKWYIKPSTLVMKEKKSPLKISSNTIQLLQETAESITNEKLKKALEKLTHSKLPQDPQTTVCVDKK